MRVENEYGAALVVAAQAGDVRARDELVAASLPLVYNIVGRALRGHADVDDVVQETMLRAVDGLAALRDPACFRSWLVAIAINQVRRRYALRSTAAALDEVGEYADPGGDFVDLTILRLGLSGQRREVAEATRWLDADDRALLALWWLEAAGELPRAELASALGLSPQHAAVRVQRMKGQLEAARVVVRALAARPPCPELAAATAGWDGLPTPLWRKRLARHVRGCRGCGAHGRGLAPAEGLLAGLALVPPLIGLSGYGGAHTSGAAAAVSHAVDGAASATGGTAPATAGDAAEAVRTAAGGPVRRAGPRRRPRATRHAVTLAVVVALTVALTAAVLLTRPDSAAPDRAPSALVPPAAEAPAPTLAVSSPPPPTAGAPTEAPTPDRPAGTSASRTPTPDAAETRRALEREVVELVNRRRTAHGCAPVRVDERLRTAARKHSDDMASRHFYDHVDPDGVRPEARISAAGYRWSLWGENLDRGRADAAWVLDDWMGSPVHRDNILDCGFQDIGVGVTVGPGGTAWWTQNFATAR